MIFMLCFCTSCKKTDKQLRIELKREVAVEFSKTKKELRPILDSLCLLNREQFIRTAVDSIVKVRKQKVLEILKK